MPLRASGGGGGWTWRRLIQRRRRRAECGRRGQQGDGAQDALDTHVVTPDGYSGLHKKDFRDYCSTVSATFDSRQIPYTNRLLSGDTDVPVYQGIAGVKNGETTNAGATFTGAAQRNGKVLIGTVMHPAKREHKEVYKETAKLLDRGFQADGKVTPVGELVPPQSAALGRSCPRPAPCRGSRPFPRRSVRRPTCPEGSPIPEHG
ncbi:hypothetical protein GCM10010508_16130 [Streptomyces naganishii JCM 4654]|uniref:D-alanyl-D-alanine carboxypeptidase n=1 Tax=Streptomyces naganishii JCM 4654 TaxID=1306179 RepID=A0A918Y0E2_9ACTN|nr:hypothetical protein GCM10010508_16130 [Streptomyces naganishii JCM 4654]